VSGFQRKMEQIQFLRTGKWDAIVLGDGPQHFSLTTSDSPEQKIQEVGRTTENREDLFSGNSSMFLVIDQVSLCWR